MDKAADGTYYCLFRSMIDKEERKEDIAATEKHQETAGNIFDFFEEPKKKPAPRAPAEKEEGITLWRITRPHDRSNHQGTGNRTAEQSQVSTD